MALLEITSKPEVINPILDTICTWQFWVIGLPFMLFCLLVSIGWIIEGFKPTGGAIWTGCRFISYDPDNDRADKEEDDHTAINVTITHVPAQACSTDDAGSKAIECGTREIRYEKPAQTDADLPSPFGETDG